MFKLRHLELDQNLRNWTASSVEIVYVSKCVYQQKSYIFRRSRQWNQQGYQWSHHFNFKRLFLVHSFPSGNQSFSAIPSLNLHGGSFKHGKIFGDFGRTWLHFLPHGTLHSLRRGKQWKFRMGKTLGAEWFGSNYARKSRVDYFRNETAY